MLSFGNLDKEYKKMIAQALRKRMDEDPLFKAKCDSSTKTLDGVLSYVKGEARKRSEGSCAVIPDEEVYQWAVHYVIEDSLDCEPKTTKAKPSTSKTVAETSEDVADEPESVAKATESVAKPVEKPRKTLKAQVDDQLTFDFGGLS